MLLRTLSTFVYKRQIQLSTELITIQWINVDKTNSAIHWAVISPVDNWNHSSVCMQKRKRQPAKRLRLKWRWSRRKLAIILYIHGKRKLLLFYCCSLVAYTSVWFCFIAETSSGLKKREMVDFILNRSLDALRDYIKCSYPDKPSRFAHILLRLPTLRGVCSKMAHKCLFAQSFLNLAVPQVLSFILQMKR